MKFETLFFVIDLYTFLPQIMKYFK